MFDNFDPNKTLRHVPYRVIKAKHKEWERRTDQLYTFLVILAIVFVLLAALAQALS
jgi:hypothetical protein